MATPIDIALFETEAVRIGRFRCPIGCPDFDVFGRPTGHLVVFPRTAVWIRPSGSAAFVADPTVATTYYPGQEYTRRALASDGDRSDWFAVASEVALAIAEDARAGAEIDPLRPFGVPFVPVDIRLYARQRQLYTEMRRGTVEPLDAEERALDIVADAIGGARDGRRPGPAANRATEEAHRDLAMRAKALLARNLSSPVSLTKLARDLVVSPYHLCRVFRRQTGTTLHRHRLDLRLRVALERLTTPGADLSQLALDLGFSSHSHFTSAFHRHMGAAPSAVRRTLRGRTPA